jgi:hypothetical protein
VPGFLQSDGLHYGTATLALAAKADIKTTSTMRRRSLTRITPDTYLSALHFDH